MIRLRDIDVVFAAGTALETHALRSVDLEIAAGDFVTVIGSNGAGKSTLLNILSGALRPSAGKVEIDSTDVTAWSTEKRAALVARVFQDPMAGSCEALSMEENLALAAARGRRRGLAPALGRSLRGRLRAALGDLGLGLEDRLGDPMGMLSGGQRQAVSLLMATLQPMKILLLDEHTAALDPRTGISVLDLTRRLVEAEALTTLMVTHSMRQALDVGNRTLMLHQGRIVFDLAGDERRGLEVADLLRLFEQSQGEGLADDGLLLG